jgi:probable F420-dependent oxidoreductase
VQVETLLPLGKVDPGLRTPETPLDIRTVAADAARVEAMGFDGLVVEETKDDPFQVLALAAQATSTLRLGTAVAIAFPRSPAVTAMAAWTLQKLSDGRFTLGLGTQVRGHIRRRYGMAWSPPAPWMRDYIAAVRAIWHAWQTETPIDFEGEHYRLNLSVPLFTPAPLDHPDIDVHMAAVGSVMCQVAGEAADGMRPHPVCTPSYIRNVMRPAAERGAARAGRTLDRFVVAHKPLVATAPDPESLAVRVRDVRARIAFYASTPGYRAAFAHHGLGGLADELASLSREQRWEEMPQHIHDDVLHTYATVGLWEEIGDRLAERYAGVVDRIEFSIAAHDEQAEAAMGKLIDRLRDV